MSKTKPGPREILTAAVFIGVIGVFFTLNFIVPSPDILTSERRAPARLPELSPRSVLSANFMNKFEGYAADNFVFRGGFMEIHSFMTFNILLQSDKQGLYLSESVGAGEFRRTDADAFRQTAEKIKTAAESLSGITSNIYYSVIPDKSIYAEYYMPGFDLAAAENVLFDVLGDYEYINLADTLGAGCFYKTDLHWNQAKISAPASRLLSSMGAETAKETAAEIALGKFRGVYAGQLALPMEPDTLSYIDIQNLTVSYLNEKTLLFEPGPVYREEYFDNVDPYDVFLEGPQPLIIIENKNAPERELILFRDSFSSSLAPLLAASYSKITLVDLRYINFPILNQFTEFSPGSDVLFLYSSQILGNPSVLQI